MNNRKLVKLWERPSYDGNGFTYYLLYIDETGKRRQKSLGHADRRKAERERDQFERHLRTNPADACSLTIKEFARDSFERTGNQIRESSRNEYASVVNDFAVMIGNIDYRKITLEHGEKYRQACLDKGNSPATVAKKLTHMKCLFQLAVKRRQLDENPFRFIDMPRIPKKKISIYTDAECQNMLKVAAQHCRDMDPLDGLRWDILVAVALTTGMRRAELLNCTWADVDFEKQIISIRPKRNTDTTWQWDIKDADERTVPLTEDVTVLLAEHQSKQPVGYPYVFVPAKRYDYIQNLRRRGKWKYCDARLKIVSNFRRKFQKILTAANARKGQFHDLRRTAITNWFVNGMNENDVMVLAGHSNFETTHKFYLAVANDLVDRARKASATAIGSNLLQICCTRQWDENARR